MVVGDTQRRRQESGEFGHLIRATRLLAFDFGHFFNQVIHNFLGALFVFVGLKCIRLAKDFYG